MRFTSEQHMSMAKRLRERAKNLFDLARDQAIAASNKFIVLAALAAKARGGITTSGFDFKALDPNWKLLDDQIGRLRPLESDGLHTAASPATPQEDRNAQVRQLFKSA